MVYMVDACLRSSTVKLVRMALTEEHRGKTTCLRENELGTVVKDKMGIFYQLLKNVIGKKLQKFSTSELDNLTLTSNVFLGEGHGSIEISEPPTEAQERIIKSLVKVVFHQLATGSGSNNSNCFEDVDEGHANLLLSLFIKKIHCDLFEESDLLLHAHSFNSDLHENIRRILNCEERSLKDAVSRTAARLQPSFLVHLFCCLEDLHGSESKVLLEEFDKIDLEDNGNNEEEDSDGPTLTSLSTCSDLLSKLQISKQTLCQTRITLLPSNEFEGLWESLHFEGKVKQRIYSYATVALKVASLSSKIKDKSSDNLVGNNKLLLIHGPPGTGKTTVCKSLCHKLSVRKEFSAETDPIEPDYKGVVVEISCSRIFSRWFGESSKNLTSIFNDVEHLLKVNQQDASFVCLLIDEVEAIAFSRSDLLNKNESTDGVRVVSTLLTQLDRLKKYNNLLILATSNLLESLDPAFVDRADGVFFIGNPSQQGTAKILETGLNELISKGVISVLGDPSNVLETQRYREIIEAIAEKCFVCTTVEIRLTLPRTSERKILTYSRTESHLDCGNKWKNAPETAANMSIRTF